MYKLGGCSPIQRFQHPGAPKISFPSPGFSETRGPCSGRRNLTPCQEMLWKSSKNRGKKTQIQLAIFRCICPASFLLPFWILVYKMDTKKNNGVLFYHQFHHENIVILEYIIYVEHCRTTVLPQYRINRCRPCNKEEVSPLVTSSPFFWFWSLSPKRKCLGTPFVYFLLARLWWAYWEVPRPYPQTSWQTWPGKSPAHLVRGFPS